MDRVFIGIGSNLGDKIANIQEAIRLIGSELGVISSTSSFYESEPWGFESPELFINSVVEICTEFSALELLDKLKKIENMLGRTEKTMDIYLDRLIDLDILYYGDVCICSNGLEIPHPRIYNRRFVLEPMVEIAPNFMDLNFNKSMIELLNSCSDRSVLKKMLN